MSSHREAPEISKDPVADSTDVYAFVSPQQTDQVCLIANFIPLQKPDGGPNFYEFADDVLYEIHVTNRNSNEPAVTYQFEFNTEVRARSFLYNTGQVNNISDETWNRPQYYKVTKVTNGRKRVIAKNLLSPPVNVGTRSMPDYNQLASQGTYRRGQRRIFAGQRADAFHVDLGSVFDLAGLRPFNEAHLVPLATMDGINSVQAYNVHTIAIQVPISELTRDGSVPTNPEARKSTIGVYATASRRKARVYNRRTAKYQGSGPWQQVSRLANPLVNEVLIPMQAKDKWNQRSPSTDGRYEKFINQPELAGLLPVLYPGVFPNLESYDKPRADLNAILHTGIPKGVVPGFANYTGPVQSDLLRLNVAVPPTDPGSENPIGLIAGDAAGFPNGRRPIDDVVAIELRAVAGATIPLVDPSYTPDDAAGQLTDGTSTYDATPLLPYFPYLGLPGGGYQTTPPETTAEPTNPGDNG